MHKPRRMCALNEVTKMADPPLAMTIYLIRAGAGTLITIQYTAGSAWEYYIPKDGAVPTAIEGCRRGRERHGR